MRRQKAAVIMELIEKTGVKLRKSGEEEVHQAEAGEGDAPEKGEA